MTQEEKLLLKDLSARLPYGVVIHQVETGDDEEAYCINIPQEALYTRDLENHNVTTLCPIGGIKPYLRPMSSMTEEEKSTMDSIWKEDNKLVFADPDKIRRYRFYDIAIVDFLNSRHFDYRGLIEKGLALEAPKGVYNLNKN